MKITIHLNAEQISKLADEIAKRMHGSSADDTPLTVKQAAARLGISTASVNRRLKGGKIPRVPGLGRTLIPASAVRELAAGKSPTIGGDGK
jgi:hypothetical protein